MCVSVCRWYIVHLVYITCVQMIAINNVPIYKLIVYNQTLLSYQQNEVSLDLVSSLSNFK